LEYFEPNQPSQQVDQKAMFCSTRSSYHLISASKEDVVLANHVLWMVNIAP